MKQQAGLQALRCVNRVLTELPLTPTAANPVWVATIWPTDQQWQRHLWVPLPAGRGWQVPAELNVADLIEIGADRHISRRFGADRTEPHRWYATALALDNGFLHTTVGTDQLDVAWATRGQVLDRYREQAVARATPALAPYLDDLVEQLPATATIGPTEIAATNINRDQDREGDIDLDVD